MQIWLAKKAIMSVVSIGIAFLVTALVKTEIDIDTAVDDWFDSKKTAKNN